MEFRFLGCDGKLYLLVYGNRPQSLPIYKPCVTQEVFGVVQNVTVEMFGILPEQKMLFSQKSLQFNIFLSCHNIYIVILSLFSIPDELTHQKNNNLLRRKQRRRSAVQ